MSLFPLRKQTKYIILHCTASAFGSDLSAKDIDRMHRQQGFSAIGYNRLIRLDGTVEQGRPDDAVGAHVAGWNSVSIGVSYVGGLDAKGKAKDTRTDAQKAAMARVVAELLVKYPGAQVLGHRDFSPDKNGDGRITPDEWIKQCPCFDAASWWASAKTVPHNAHVVAKGETLWSIARRHGRTVEAIAQANGITDPSTIKADAVLTIPD
jgi:N-acetylmuramoyl-L-alanine amidase